MNILMKIFITLAAFSMFAGLLYAFGFMSGLIPYKDVKIGLFIILWLGPLMVVFAVSVPVLIYKLWNEE